MLLMRRALAAPGALPRWKDLFLRRHNASDKGIRALAFDMIELLRQGCILFAPRLLAGTQQRMLSNIPSGKLARRVPSLLVSYSMCGAVGVNGTVVRTVEHSIAPTAFGHGTHRALPSALPVLAKRSFPTRVRSILAHRTIASREVFAGCPRATFIRLFLQSKIVNNAMVRWWRDDEALRAGLTFPRCCHNISYYSTY